MLVALLREWSVKDLSGDMLMPRIREIVFNNRFFTDMFLFAIAGERTEE